ncbi:hypothetical protein FKM82_017809 [Ascaphus truei]
MCVNVMNILHRAERFPVIKGTQLFWVYFYFLNNVASTYLILIDFSISSQKHVLENIVTAMFFFSRYQIFCGFSSEHKALVSLQQGQMSQNTLFTRDGTVTS